MAKYDALTEKNRVFWENEVKQQARYATPWLDLNAEAFRLYAAGKLPSLSLPRWKGIYGPMAEYEDLMMRQAVGKDVLCLASGGGQQSALYGLLGAHVTVLDLTEGQLRLDQAAAMHYGYAVRTVQGDMRDLSAFQEESFDLIDQPVSICFVPDVHVVYRQVHRVLRPDGLYRVSHCNPATCPVSFTGSRSGWDGTGYRIADPYLGGPILEDSNGTENMQEGSPTGEFRHLLSDVFNGLIKTGLEIVGVWEDPRHLGLFKTVEPGSEEHQLTCVADYFSIVARKR